MSEEAELLSPRMTVLSMINGMIGGFILLLPVLALQTGYISTLIVILITGAFSYYSSYLCISHIGKEQDLDSAVYKHFGKSNKMRMFYDLCVWSSLLLIDFLYFELIVIQWVGLAPPHEFTTANVILNAFLLFAITMAMKYFEFGANLMAYGIISIATYVVFLTWVVGSQETTGSHVQYKPFGEGAVELTAGMGQAFAIQSFFIPVLKQSRSSNHNRLVLIAYIIGGIVYTYIAFMGSYGILYREYLGYSDGQSTIEGYFGVGAWEVNCIEVIYLIHLYSVFPQFLLISKKRLFGVLNYSNTPKKRFNIHQVVYIGLSIGACLAITLMKMSIREIIDLNGAFIGCLFVYILPAALHIRCLYFSNNKVPLVKQMEENKYDEMVEQNNMELEKKENNKSHQENIQTPIKKMGDGNDVQMKQVQKWSKNAQEDTVQTYECDCSLQSYSRSQRIVTLIFVGSMVVLALSIMINGLIDLLTD